MYSDDWVQLSAFSGGLRKFHTEKCKHRADKSSQKNSISSHCNIHLTAITTLGVPIGPFVWSQQWSEARKHNKCITGSHLCNGLQIWHHISQILPTCKWEGRSNKSARSHVNKIINLRIGDPIMERRQLWFLIMIFGHEWGDLPMIFTSDEVANENHWQIASQNCNSW